MATVAPIASRDEQFFQKMMIGLSVFILFGFAQFAARGFVDFRAVPTIFHVHGAVMVGWLGLAITQATLAARDKMALHRQLGWTGAVLATLITPLAIATCVAALATGIVPPFFTPPFFLSLVTLGALGFTLMVWAAIRDRRRTEWHRRLMIGAMIFLMEPALGRLLPMPLTGGETGEWLALVAQLLTIGLLARHDRATLGQVHPATLITAVAVIAVHALISIASRLPPVIALANGLAA